MQVHQDTCIASSTHVCLHSCSLCTVCFLARVAGRAGARGCAVMHVHQATCFVPLNVCIPF